MSCVKQWRDIGCPSQVLKWIESGVDIYEMFTHFKGLIEGSIVIGKTKKGGSHSPTLPTMEIEPLAILSKRVVDIKSEKPEQLGEFEKYIEGVESPS
jgi:hypothetical protein